MLIFWIATVLVSTGMEISNLLYLFRDIFNEGNKIRYEKLEDLFSIIGYNEKYLKILCPGINIYFALENEFKYKKNEDKIISELKIKNVIVPMTYLESGKFKQNSTLFNTFLTFINFKRNLKNSIIHDDGELTIIRNVNGKGIILNNKDFPFYYDKELKLEALPSEPAHSIFTRDEKIIKIGEIKDQLLKMTEETDDLVTVKEMKKVMKEREL